MYKSTKFYKTLIKLTEELNKIQEDEGVIDVVAVVPGNDATGDLYAAVYESFKHPCKGGCGATLTERWDYCENCDPVIVADARQLAEDVR